MVMVEEKLARQIYHYRGVLISPFVIVNITQTETVKKMDTFADYSVLIASKHHVSDYGYFAFLTIGLS